LILFVTLKGSKIASMQFGQFLMSTASTDQDHFGYLQKSINKGILEVKFILFRFIDVIRFHFFRLFRHNIIWTNIFSCLYSFLNLKYITKIQVDFQESFQPIISKKKYWIEQIAFLQKIHIQLAFLILLPVLQNNAINNSIE
jgi:hypothetical protein